MINIKKTTPKSSGFMLSAITLMMFCTITINQEELHAPSTLQIAAISIIQIISISLLPSKSRIKINNKLLSISLILITASTASSLLSSHPITSATRLFVTYAAATAFIYLLIGKQNVTDFSTGIMNGIIIITSFSVLYSLIGALSSENYISRAAADVITIKAWGMDFSQKVAHRSFLFNESKYLVQRLSGILPNPNGFALICAIMFGFSYNPEYSNRLKFIIRIIAIIGLGLSFSRMGILLFLSTLTYMSLSSVKFRKIFVVASTASLIFFLIFSAASSNALLSNIPLVQKLEFLQLRERADSWVLAWNAAKQNWGFGVGFGVSSEYLFGDAANIQAVHSVFLNSFLEVGAVGTVALIALWLTPALSDNYTADSSSTAEAHRHVISGVLFGLFVAEAFDLSITRFHYIHLIFFTLLGIWLSLTPNKDDIAGQNARSYQSPTLP